MPSSPTFLAPDLTGSFGCGSFQCSYQMGQSAQGAYQGVYLNLALQGGNTNGQWVQTYIDSNTVQFTNDCGPCSNPPYFPSYTSSGNWFFDYPERIGGSQVTWVAQTSYVLPNHGGAAFTVQWGFVLSNTSSTYIPPVVVAPWAFQQRLIQGAK